MFNGKITMLCVTYRCEWDFDAKQKILKVTLTIKHRETYLMQYKMSQYKYSKMIMNNSETMYLNIIQ